MNHRKTVPLLLCAVTALFLLSAGLTAGEALTVTDVFGASVTLERPAERIVAIQPSDCEIVFALGAGDRLVGRGEYCDYPAEVAAIPAVASGYDTNVEEIFALAPDLVIINSMDSDPAVAELLRTSGIPVLKSDSSDIAAVYTNIRSIGTLLGKTSEAEALVASMETTFAAVSANRDALAGKTVYFEVSPLQWGLWTAGAGSFMDEIAAMMGLENAFHDVSGWAPVSEEQVITRDPDYIVTVGMYFGEGLTPSEEILGRTGWQDMKAVRNGAVLNLRDNELSRPSWRLAEGARLLFDFVTGCDNAAE